MLKERSERGREEVDPCWTDDPQRYDDVNDVSWIHRMYRFILYDLDDVIVTCLFSLTLVGAIMYNTTGDDVLMTWKQESESG